MMRINLKETIALFIVLSAALVLRLLSIQFGLPFLYHADEPVIVNHAVAYGSGDFNPHFFRVPPLTSYLLFSCYGLFFIIGKAVGWFSNVTDFEYLFYRDASSFYLIARVIFGAFVSTLTLLILFQLIKKYFSFTKAILTIFLLAVNFLHIRDSQYIYVDNLLLLFIVLSFFPILAIAKGEKTVKTHVLAGVLIGAATASKYNGIALVLPYLAAAWKMKDIKNFLSKGIVAGLCCVGVFLMLNPFALIDYTYFFQEMRGEAAAHTGFMWLFHLKHSLLGAMEWPLLMVTILGLIKVFFDRDKLKTVLAMYVLSYYLIICLFGQPYARYVLPLLPILIFFPADLIVAVFRRGFKSQSNLGIIMIVFALSLPGIVKSICYHSLMNEKDTRTLAHDWILNNIPSGEQIALEIPFYMPRLRKSVAQLSDNLQQQEQGDSHADTKTRKLKYLSSLSEANTAYDLYELSNEPTKPTRFSLAKPLIAYSYSDLKKTGIDYVVVVRLRENDLNNKFYQDLTQKSERVAVFSPYKSDQQKWTLMHPLTGGPFTFKDILSRERNGQYLEIYKV